MPVAQVFREKTVAFVPQDIERRKTYNRFEVCSDNSFEVFSLPYEGSNIRAIFLIELDDSLSHSRHFVFRYLKVALCTMLSYMSLHLIHSCKTGFCQVADAMANCVILKVIGIASPSAHPNIMQNFESKVFLY